MLISPLRTAPSRSSLSKDISMQNSSLITSWFGFPKAATIAIMFSSSPIPRVRPAPSPPPEESLQQQLEKRLIATERERDAVKQRLQMDSWKPHRTGNLRRRPTNTAHQTEATTCQDGNRYEKAKEERLFQSKWMKHLYDG